MNHQIDPQLYRQCEKAFLTEVATTVKSVVARVPTLNEEERRELTSKLVFAIAAHLAGGSFAGRVDKEEIYPVLGFSQGEADGTVYFGRGSALQEIVSSVL